MTPERKIELNKLAACSIMFGNMVTVGLTDSAITHVAAIVITIGCLYWIHLTFQWERALLKAEWEALNERYNNFVRDCRRQYDMPTQSRFFDGLGDGTCLHNARSRYLQCAINPTGKCAECPDYVSIFFDHPQNQKDHEPFQDESNGAT